MSLVPVVLGLTGGIGSGKSTVATLFKTRGAELVDADAIARECTSTGGMAMSAILDEFGCTFITNDGGLDRRKMKELIFSSAGAKKKLEGIIHPCVLIEVTKRIRFAQGSNLRCVVLDIPLLVESHYWRAEVDKVLIVDCLESTQFQRVGARDGMDTSLIERIMSTQAHRTARLSAADIVLFNDSITLSELAQQVTDIAGQFGL